MEAYSCVPCDSSPISDRVLRGCTYTAAFSGIARRATLALAREGGSMGILGIACGGLGVPLIALKD